MAVNLGNLDDFLAEEDITFTIGGKQYGVTISAKDMLKFNAIEERTQADKIGAYYLWERACDLVGTTFDQEEMTFKGGLIGKVLKENPKMSYEVLGRLLTSIYLKARWTDDVAKTFAETGDVGKALGVEKVVKALEDNDTSSADSPNPETQPEPGETAGEDSAEK
ncbi:hypothetical protein CPHO_08315 [Corynebacterium phocae]|uniref:Uncharacterized protein n=1 Tax=Corynebacterium phocae TaxID=161895 RepID=A0A1L7D436_9CORY|nr:hypothetical protein [Corynebacterium phocae]APT92888.1 hypothetical protein CPHO_08315 [Corynebacterium phocae]KAA8723210.1 hypothetical protein F4V58_07810 [Corynebacterium phocae]